MRMIEDQIIARGIKNPALIGAMKKIPRHEFVPEEHQEYAYEDHPLPIGEGQTISQPYVVALMTDILNLKGKEKVLEIGSGSGYQAAILSELAGEVYSVEISPVLASRAKKILEKLGIKKVNINVGDGYEGWAENAPYDAIIVTCAPDHIPQAFIDQLAEGGKLVIPVGPPGSFQTLWLVEKIKGKLVHHNLGGVIFVPMRRKG